MQAPVAGRTAGHKGRGARLEALISRWQFMHTTSSACCETTCPKMSTLALRLSAGAAAGTSRLASMLRRSSCQTSMCRCYDCTASALCTRYQKQTTQGHTPKSTLQQANWQGHSTVPNQFKPKRSAKRDSLQSCKRCAPGPFSRCGAPPQPHPL